MLLTETIKNSTSAIKKRRATIESKQHAETYARALAQLSQTTGSIKDALDCAIAIKESGIVEAPVIDCECQRIFEPSGNQYLSH